MRWARLVREVSPYCDPSRTQRIHHRLVKNRPQSDQKPIQKHDSNTMQKRTETYVVCSLDAAINRFGSKFLLAEPVFFANNTFATMTIEEQ